MRQIDYKQLRALAKVIQLQSFEQAAEQLNISQSAISQRIKLLEESIGHPVIIRSKPLSLTTIGQQLVAHYQKVEHLELEIIDLITPETPNRPIRLSLAVNADSLATWFLDALAPLVRSHPIELDILVCDEARTIEKLRSGEAFGAVSLVSTPLPGYKAEYLGEVKYSLVASPEFHQRYFKDGISRDSLKHAPGVTYDHLDDMHYQFIEQHFGLTTGEYPCHIVRSSEAFVDLAKKGLAYCLVPELQTVEELQKGTLVKIAPKLILIEKLYWHSWIIGKGVFKQASNLIVEHGRKLFLSDKETN